MSVFSRLFSREDGGASQPSPQQHAGESVAERARAAPARPDGSRGSGGRIAPEPTVIVDVSQIFEPTVIVDVSLMTESAEVLRQDRSRVDDTEPRRDTNPLRRIEELRHITLEDTSQVVASSAGIAVRDTDPDPRPALALPLAAADVPGVASLREPLAAPYTVRESAFERLVDAAVDALIEPHAGEASMEGVAEQPVDRQALIETFAAVAKLHGRPLRDLMFQLSVGRTPTAWARVCRPVLAPLVDAAKQIGWDELAEALARFDATLEHAASEAAHTSSGSGAAISDGARAAIQVAYEELRLYLPEVFSAPSPADSRRFVLFESLLLQVPSIHRRTISKLYAAGLSSIAQLGRAQPDELSAVAGMDPEIANAIIDHIRRFEREREHVDPTTLRAQLQTRVRAVIGRLGQLQAEFERAEQEASRAHKRAVRRARESVLLELDRLIAELGDVALIGELKRCSVRDKIRRVQGYLQDLQAAG